MAKCLMENCESEAWSRGYCQKHYSRLKRAGKIKNLPKKSGFLCLAEGCDRIVGKDGGFGFCSKHYQRYKKYGDPNKVYWKRLEGETIEEKLKANYFENENGCWIWKGGKNSRGYGSINIGNRKTAQVHRIAFKLWKGELPDDLFVCHHCDEPLCINPDHLFLGTNQDNIDDKMFKGRAYTGVHLGEKNESSILTDEKVKEIKKLLLQKKKYQSEIAKQFKVSKQCITDIKLEHRWKHIPWPDLSAHNKKRKRKRKRL